MCCHCQNAEDLHIISYYVIYILSYVSYCITGYHAICLYGIIVYYIVLYSIILYYIVLYFVFYRIELNLISLSSSYSCRHGIWLGSCILKAQQHIFVFFVSVEAKVLLGELKGGLSFEAD